jgi:hypothetical protein
MTSVTLTVAASVVGIPGLGSGDLAFPSAEVAASSAFITIPIGILLLILARVFWRGKYLGLVAGYKEYGVAQPRKMGRFVGSMVGALGVFQLAFPFLVRLWGQGAFVAFVFVVVGMGVAIIIGGAHFEKG